MTRQGLVSHRMPQILLISKSMKLNFQNFKVRVNFERLWPINEENGDARTSFSNWPVKSHSQITTLDGFQASVFMPAPTSI